MISSQKILRGLFLIALIARIGISSSSAQTCGVMPDGDEVSFGNGAWIGYVYDQRDDFSTANYRGTINQNESFDENFGGNGGSFSTNAPCDVDLSTFTVRFKMRKNFPCGEYQLTIGGDDGVRLSIDGGNTYIINDYSNHAYRTSSANVLLDGTTDLVFDYYESGGGNRVSFEYQLIDSDGSGGEISNSDQVICGSGTPSIFDNAIEADFCVGTVSYQWQSSADNVAYTDIIGATSATYTASNLPGITYYRRKASNGLGTDRFSNVGVVEVQSPSGDEVTYGTSDWIGYVYEGQDNFSSNYLGEITVSEIFDENFSTSPLPTSGCSLIEPETFSVRFKLRKTFAAGVYSFTIGGDDGVRLSLDGGSTYFLNDYSNHGYRTTTGQLCLDGSVDMILEYYEASGGNRVSFSYTFLGSSTGGTISGNQTYCDTSLDPDPFVSEFDAIFCSGGTITYQWQESLDNSSFTDITGATNASLDLSSFPVSTTKFYRRSANNGSTTIYSNTIEINNGDLTGDEVTYGINSWKGYIYSGANNFSNYSGFIDLTETFDTNFGGSNTFFSTDGGCEIETYKFTMRTRMRKTFSCGTFTFTVGADDGYRLSFDGGATYIIDEFDNGAYRTSQFTSELEGSYDLVLDYFENSGDNRLSFNYTKDNDICDNPMPVELTYFQATHLANGIELNWQTASELNNNYFEIQHSTSGKEESFKQISIVYGNGTTNSFINYNYLHENPIAGYNYYRLKQVDFDGQFEYSPIILESFEPTNYIQKIEIYPSPVTGNDLNIEIQENTNSNLPLSVKFYSLNGRLRWQTSFGPSFENRYKKIDIPADVDNGTYILNLMIGSKHVKKTIIINR